MSTEQPRRYLDNAATSFPKPPGVADAVADFIARQGASAGRGAYREALAAERILTDCRDGIRQLFCAASDDSVVFTLNGTDALNIAIKGLVSPGAHVLTTVLEHNSVARPLKKMEDDRDVAWSTVPVDPRSTLLDPDAVRAGMRDNTELVVVNHASNVTGALQPIAEVAAICREAGALLLVDAAQSAGHVPIAFADWGVDLLATPGHKGLMGPQGTGVLLIRADLAERLDSLREGGTGSHSEQVTQPLDSPERFESGTHNLPGIAGLLKAVTWLAEQSIEHVRNHELALCRRMIDRLAAVPNLQWYGPRTADRRVGVFCVRTETFEPESLSAILESDFGILTRSGLHCAPLAHQTIATIEHGGATRFSFGAFTKREDVDAACDALVRLAGA